MRKFTVGLLAMMVAGLFYTQTVNAAVAKMITMPQAKKTAAKKAATPVTAKPVKTTKTAAKAVPAKAKTTVKNTKQTAVAASKQKAVSSKAATKAETKWKTAGKSTAGKTAEKASVAKNGKWKTPATTAYQQPAKNAKYGKTAQSQTWSKTSVKNTQKTTQKTVAQATPKKVTTTYKPVTQTAYKPSQSVYSTYTPAVQKQSDSSLPAFVTSGGPSSGTVVQTTASSAPVIGTTSNVATTGTPSVTPISNATPSGEPVTTATSTSATASNTTAAGANTSATPVTGTAPQTATVATPTTVPVSRPVTTSSPVTGLNTNTATASSASAKSQSAYLTPPISSFGQPKTRASFDAPITNASLPAKQSIYVSEMPNGPDTRAKSVLVLDENDLKILYERNSTTRMPIASVTKLMTAYIVVESMQNMNEVLEISEDDIDHLKGTGSRLRIGTRLTRGEMLHLALMSSENRAASALGRYYPGGRAEFVKAMNIKAAVLGMTNTHYVDTNGLSPQNVSCARDLAKLVMAAAEHPLIRKYSTAEYHTINDGEKTLNYGSTNRLTHSPSWKIQVQKTGYIREAGQCLVMKTTIDGRPIIMVLLNVVGPKGARIVDAQHIKNWLTHTSDDDSSSSSGSFFGSGRSTSNDSDFYD